MLVLSFEGADAERTIRHRRLDGRCSKRTIQEISQQRASRRSNCPEMWRMAQRTGRR
jgi:hypothetical protein